MSKQPSMHGATLKGWLLATASLLAGTAMAEALPPPGTADPQLKRGQIERQLDAVREEQRATEREIPALRGEPLPEQSLPASGESFTLEGVQFTPSRFLDEQWLKETATGYVGRPVSFDDLNQLLATINAAYEKKGVLTARAIIPPQKLAAGVLKVVLVEAKLDKVLWNRDPVRVERSFYTDRIVLRPGDTLDPLALTDAIRRLNDTTPGPQLTASLAKGDEFGTTQVQFEPVEPETLRWQIFANNHGAESTGRTQYGASLLWYSPTRHADVLSGTVVKTDGTVYGNVRYAYPVNRHNGSLYLDLSRNQLEIRRGPYANLNIRGESGAGELGYRHPFWLSDAWMVTSYLAWNHSESKTTIEGFALSKTDGDNRRLGALVQYRSDASYGALDQSVTVADERNKVTETTGRFTIASGNLFAQHRFEQPFRIESKATWQHTDDVKTLPSALLYQVGGIASVRGYESGVVAGPRGYGVSLDGYWNAMDGLEVGLVGDYGVALDVGTQNVSASSLGLAANWQWKRATLSAVIAWPKEIVTPRQDPTRFWLQVSVQ